MQYVTEERNLVGAAELEFHCNQCGSENQLDGLRFKTVDRLFGLIPIWFTYETAIKCPDCDATFRTSIDLPALQQLPPEELSACFKLRIGLVEKFLVIAGWLLIISGPVALGLFIAAWFMVPKATTGWRMATNIGLVLTGLITTVVASVLITHAILD